MKNKNDKREWFRVTIKNEETGEVLTDEVTNAIMLVRLFENEETRKMAEERGTLSKAGVVVQSCVSKVSPFDMLSMLDGLQRLMQDTLEGHPEMELLAQLVKTESTEVTKEET